MIKIKELIGEYCSQRQDSPSKKGGETIRDLILQEWDKGNIIEVSFEDVKLATPSFVDEAFGKLLLNHSLDELKKKLKFIKVDKETKEKINKSIELRIKQKQNGDIFLDS